MNAVTWSTPAIVIGMMVAFLGPIAIDWLVPVDSQWSEADAIAKNNAAAEFHSTLQAHAHDQDDASSSGHGHLASARGIHEHAAQNDGASSQHVSVEQARTEADRHQAMLDGAISQHGWLLLVVRILGVLIASAGVAGAIAAWQSE